MTARFAPVPLVALLLSACRPSSPDVPIYVPPPVVPPPVPVTVAVVATGLGRFELSWKALPTPMSVEVEQRVADGPFEQILDASGWPARWGSPPATIQIDGLPELEKVAFRVRSLLEGVPSAWSDPVEVRQPLLPVSGLVAAAAIGPDGNAGPPITVRWAHPSALATEVEVQRGVILWGEIVYPPPVVPDSWQPLAADASRDWILDEPGDGAFYRYRVRRGAAGTWSAWAETDLRYPLLAPLDLRVETLVDGGTGVPNAFRLTWTNRSTGATEIWARRLTGWFVPENLPIDVAILPIDATSHVDLFPAWSNWAYKVEAHAGYLPVARTPPVGVPPFVIPGDPPVQASSVDLFCNGAVLRDGAGRWACIRYFIDDSYAYRSAVYWMRQGGAWEQHVSPEGWITAFLDLDAAGAPHALSDLRRVLTFGALHSWWDGATWQEEEVPLPQPDPADPYLYVPSVLGFGVTGAGAPVVLVMGRDSLLVLSKGEAGWTERPIHGSFDFLMFGVAPDGTAVLFGDNWGVPCGIALLGPEDEAAEVEAIPGTDVACFAGERGVLLGIESGRIAIGYGLWRDDLDVDWYYRERDASGWRDPELVATQPFSSRVIPPRGILSPDGTRAALFLSWPAYRGAHEQVYKVFARGRLGGWRELTLGPGFPMNDGGGYFDDGRMWVLGSTEAGLAGTNHFPLYEER